MVDEKKKPSRWNKLVGAFVEVKDDPTPKADSKKTEEGNAVPIGTKPIPVTAPVVMPVVAGEADPEILERILAALNTKGPYATFMEMVTNLKDVITDEKTCYLAALKALESKGFDPEGIVKSLAARNILLSEQQTDFDRTVTKRVEEVKILQHAAVCITEEIEDLKKQIVEKETAQKNKEEEVARAQQNLSEMQGKFATAVAAVQKSLQEAQDKVTKYLMGGK